MLRSRRLKAINTRVTVSRSRRGVAHLRADNWTDAFFGLGWLHGRDRGGQVALMRAVGAGRLCELFTDTDDMLAVDVYFRRLGFARDARRAVTQLKPPYLDYVEAYAEGINRAWRRHYPLLLRLSGGRPPEFEPADVLAMIKLIAYAGLAEGQRVGELFIIDAARRGVTSEKLKALFPALDRLDMDLIHGLQEIPALFPGGRAAAGVPSVGGSNAWTVAGTRTADGAPLLANDPHLEINRLPAVIYEAVIAVGDEWVKGATIPGAPGFLSARTSTLAWGVTYSCADTSDFFVERCRQGRYLHDGRWHDFHVRHERIDRRRHPPVDLVVYENHHGILEGDATRNGDYLAWNWTGHGDGGLAAVRAFTDVLRCTTVAEAQRAMRHADLPSLHMVFADTGGNIGYQFVGAVPRRRPGWSGLAPVAGWDADNDWRGRLDPEHDTPREYNPERGYIAITNEARRCPDGPRLSTLWLADYRRQRIVECLAATAAVRPEQMQALQYDLCSLQARRFLPEYLQYLAPGPAKRLLEGWDMNYETASHAASLFEALHREVTLDVFGGGEPADREWLRERLDTTGLYITLCGFFDDVLARPDSVWLPAAHRRAVIAAALQRGLVSEPPPWGRVNRLTMPNLFLAGRAPGRLGGARGPFGLGGNHATVHQGSLFRVGTRLTSFAACYHVVHDLGSRASWSNLPGGVREFPYARWYANDLRAWRRRRYKAL